MKCILFSWNIRGLGRPEKVRAVISAVKSCNPKVLFLQETKVPCLKPVVVKRLKKAGFSDVVISPSSGASGGLVVLWEGNWLKVTKTIINPRWVCLIGQIENSNDMCCFMNLYAPNDLGSRRFFFEEISDVVSSLNMPVIMGGDFNCVRNEKERIGMEPNNTSMNTFAEFIQRNNLVDLPLVGECYTWFRGGHSVAASRLDRFLMSPEFLVWFPSIIQVSLPRSLSDHKPVIIKEHTVNSKARPFKLFSHWLNFPEVLQLTKSAIESKGEADISETLKAAKPAIKDWVKLFKQEEGRVVKEAKLKIEAIEQQMLVSGVDQTSLSELQQWRKVLWEKYRRDEREWHQKSRVRWFNEGDKNSKFFHLSATVRRCRNRVVALENNGKIYSDPKQIAREFLEFFKLQYNNSRTLSIKRFNCALKHLSDSAAKDLEAPFSDKEVWDTICSIDGNRAPGPDGLNLDFFKKFWPSLKTSVMRFFDDFYQGKVGDKGFNRSYITLIPKKPCPKFISDYRPISLIDSLYKVVAKVLSRRLARCIKEVVGENQFAFTPGKQISDCALIANEVVDEMRRKKKGLVVFKADFKRAYDSVDWRFLDLILQKMGFGNRWRRWISMCVSTARIAVLVNGFPSIFFPISRGLRQGCPLSPYLFNIFGEALSSLIRDVVRK
ncbi:hypothetical protein HRI_002754400 [Hibiscus trionum]|uniref:Reverse transcriptase domain-containing protein n=1 Tax=Hibiscus trionum TaxID=183268 RepID=A0A9W7I955_HIBTR|nr:hypothetical protein HRI_002754400 [Hibiscus trionum]